MSERDSKTADNDIMKLPTRDPNTGEAQLVDAILETPDGPLVIGAGFRTLQEAWDAVVRWSPIDP